MEKEDAKICPLFIRNFNHAKCLGKDCALYVVNAQKISPLGSVMVWEGCGLIHQVAWKYMKREKKPQ